MAVPVARIFTQTLGCQYPSLLWVERKSPYTEAKKMNVPVYKKEWILQQSNGSYAHMKNTETFARDYLSHSRHCFHITSNFTPLLPRKSAFRVSQKIHNPGGRHALHAFRRADGRRADAPQPLTHLGAEARDRVVVGVGVEAQALVLIEVAQVGGLPHEVWVVAPLCVDTGEEGPGERGEGGDERDQGGGGYAWVAEHLICAARGGGEEGS